MSKNIKLSERPKSFSKVVKFPMLDGTQDFIKCEFKYRTKKEFGQFIDGMFKDAGEVAPADGQFKLAELMGKTVDKNADYLLEVIEGWDLDDKISRESLGMLCDKYPAAASAIMDDYRAAVVEGRLGN